MGILGTFTIGRDIINNFESQQFSNNWNFASGDYHGSTLHQMASQRLPDLSQYNYWVPNSGKDGNPNATFPSLNPYGPNYYQFLAFSTMWNDNGTYFRSLKNGGLFPSEHRVLAWG